MSKDAVDLLQNMLVRRPSDRLSCHDALRHSFFTKHGLDIDAEEKATEERQKALSCKNLAEVVKSAERKIQPKVLTESAMFEPCASDVIEFRSIKSEETKKQPANTDDTLELSQSVILSESQLKAISEKVGFKL